MPTRPASELVGPSPHSTAFSGFSMDTLSWDYLSSPQDSPRAMSPLDDYALESQFCRDFFCCNIKLPNLHDLIQHYEERHVKFEDEHGLLDDWSAQGSRVNSPLNTSKHSQESAALSDIYSIEVASMSQLSEDTVSAFETAIIRNSQNARKRKISLNAQDSTTTKKYLNSARDALYNSFAGVAGLSPEELDEHLQRAIAYSYDGSHASSTYSSEAENTSPWLIRSTSMEPTMAVQPSQTNAVAAAAAAAVVSEVGGPTIVVPMPPMPMNSVIGRPPNTPVSMVPGLMGTPDKPYRCDQPGCDKTYKNKNGLKYHILNGHIDPVLKEAASQERKQQRMEERANRFSYYPQQPMFTMMPTPNTPAISSNSKMEQHTIVDVVSLQQEQLPQPVPQLTTGMLTPPVPSSPQVVPAPLTPVITPSVITPMMGLPTPVNTTPSSPVDEVFKPYRCAVSDCGKTYKNLGGLKYHIDKVHDGNPLAMAMGRKKVTINSSKPLSHPPSSSTYNYSFTNGSLSAGLFVRVPEAVPHLQHKATSSLLSATSSIIGAGMLPAPLPKWNATKF